MKKFTTPQEFYQEQILSDIRNFSFNDKVKILENCLLSLLSVTDENVYFKKIRKYLNIFNHNVSFDITVIEDDKMLKLQKEINKLFPNRQIRVSKADIYKFLLFFDNNIYDISYKNDSLDLKIKELEILKAEIGILENYTLGEISKNKKACDDNNFKEIGRVRFDELVIKKELVNTIKAMNCKDLCAVDIFEN